MVTSNVQTDFLEGCAFFFTVTAISNKGKTVLRIW
jgi:hypothetical protein